MSDVTPPAKGISRRRMTVEQNLGETDDFQVQFLDAKLEAVEIQLRAGGEMVGAATVLTCAEFFLLARMTWWPVGEAASQQRRACKLLVQEASDLAKRHDTALLAVVGPPEDLIACGFELNGSVWRLRRGE